ncbi:MAG: LLM class F420-dependent oxidoreductase [Gammaproteobacteria bacterium]
MKVGCTFPHDDIGNDPAAIRDFAQAAEALGYSHIVLYDHVLGAPHGGRTPPLSGPYTEKNAFHEIFVTLGFLAAVTTRIELCTGIVILPQRQTVLVAKQAAEVDLLSRGRLRLGVATGWNFVEYEGLNQGWADRGARFEEQVELLRRLWTEPVIDYTGRFHRIDRAGILPLPGREIPIWFGGAKDVALRRAARMGAGFIFSRPDAPASVPVLRRYVAECGRDPDAFGIEGNLNYSAGPEKWGRHLEVWRQLKASHVCIRTMGEQPIGPAAQMQALRRYAEGVGLKPG